MTNTLQDKNTRNQINREDSESEYDPLLDDTAEEGLIDDVYSKGSKEKTHENSNKHASDLPLGVKFRSRKRVYAAEQPIILTRSKKSIGQPDASVTPSDICEPPPSHPNVSYPAEVVANFEDHRQLEGEDDNFDATRESGHNHMANEDGLDQHDHNTNIIEGAYGNNQITTEGGKKRWVRGLNKGRGLHKLTRACRGRLPVVITEGNIRPMVPLIAAKFATECNIIVRQHIPVLTHWKEYKKQEVLFEVFLKTLRAKFDIDTNDENVRNGCLEMMKSAVRNRRHKLKKKYFDPFPLHMVRKTSPIAKTSNEQWLALVESWKTPKKMETCQKNKESRGNVKLPHATGSCSYEVFAETMRSKRGADEPESNALDLFKECHYSHKKNGYTPAVQAAITEMENQMATPKEDEEPKSPTQVVEDVLSKNTKHSRFLQNVGIKPARSRSSIKHVRAELQAEKRANVELREQLGVLLREQEETKKKQSEMEAKLELLLSRSEAS